MALPLDGISQENTTKSPQEGHQTMVCTLGELVDVKPEHRSGRRDSDGGRAFIQAINLPPEQVADNDADHRGTLYDVKYIVGGGNCLSQEVVEDRISHATMDNSARRRRGDTAARPSLLSNSHVPRRNNDESAAARTVTPPPNPRRKINTATPLMMVKTKLPHPKKNKGLVAVKKFNKSKEKGWLRIAEGTQKSKQFSPAEKSLALALFYALRPSDDSAGALVAVAWGTTRQSINNWERQVKKNPSNGLNIARKTRNDKGVTVFNSDKKRKAVFTPLHSFNKMHRAENKGEALTNSDCKEAFIAASPNTKKKAEDSADSLLLQAPFLVSEITRVLQMTNGSITWRRLATQITSHGSVQPVSPTTTMNYVMGLPSSSYKTTRIHPHLSKNHIKRRFDWSMEFWLFWDGAKAFIGVQVALGHMDEKWFFGIVVRKHNKDIPFLGVEAVSHSVHHKSHINKTMAIASTLFMPHNNNMESGGVSKKLSLERVGRMIKANKDTYGRVYKPDGSYHYPKTPNNIRRRKGDYYFHPCEIKGSSRGTEKKPKYSLLDFFLDLEIPRLETEATEWETRTGNKLVVRYQLDGAGPHRDEELLKRLDLEFTSRGWMLKFQPSQSPLTNVKDCCIFPAMSKEVTAVQGLKHGSHVLETETLWKVVTECWNDFEESTIARAYTGHHQIVNAIAQCKGGDQFARDSKGLHCNTRRLSVPYFESEDATTPSGIEMVESLEGVDPESTIKLKYPKPDVTQSDDTFKDLTDQEIQCLFEYYPVDGPLFQGIAAAFASSNIDIGSVDGEECE